MRAVLLYLLLVNTPLYAATPFMEPWRNQPQAFTLELQQQELALTPDWQWHSQNLQAELVHMHSPILHLAIQASRQFAQIRGMSAEHDVDTYHGGLVIRGFSPRWQQLQLGTSLGIHWQQGERGDTLSLRRHAWQPQLNLQWQVAHPLALYAGLGLWQQQGTLELNNQTYSLPTDNRQYALLGLDATIEPGGHVGLEVGRKEQKALAIYFQRRY